MDGASSAAAVAHGCIHPGEDNGSFTVIPAPSSPISSSSSSSVCLTAMFMTDALISYSAKFHS